MYGSHRRMMSQCLMRRLSVLIIALGCHFTWPQSFNERDFLSVDEAYPTEVELTDEGQVMVRWVMPAGYYLYKHSLNILGKEGTDIGPTLIPKGISKTDEFFGKVEVFYNFLEISAPVHSQTAAAVTVEVHYQGCADAGLCYPPEIRTFRLATSGAGMDLSPTLLTPETVEVTLLVAMGSALLAGLLLNLMPCVFPILSIKAIGILQSAGETNGMGHALGYLSGVVTTFLVLAVLLLVLRALGASIGWGFQLQSPSFVAAMALVFFLMSMNLWGAIELPGFGVAMAQQNAFVTGVLAVIVATPCTVPFMAVSIGYALTQGGVQLVAIMLLLGIGMALPYALIVTTPRIGKWLPRPGRWMTTFKRAMAVPLILTVAWLIWVLARQVGIEGVILVVVAMVLLTIAVVIGRRQAKRLTAVWAIMLIVIAGAVYAVSLPYHATASRQSPQFELKAFQEMVVANRPIFLNVTADWCLTCLANERTTLSRTQVQQNFADRGITYVKVDWTNRDADVTELLEQFGRYGVPMYVFYPKTGQPVVLPQVLTPDLLNEYLTERQRRSI